MCHIKNNLPVKHKVKELTQDFDTWFESLRSDLNKTTLHEKDHVEFNDMYLPAIYAPQATISPDFYSLVSDIVPLKVESPPIQFQYPSPRSVEIVSSPQPEMVSSPKQREMVSSPKSITKSTSCQSLSPIKHKTKKRSLTDEDPVLLKKRQRQNEAAKRCREKRSNQLQMAQQQVQQIEQDKFDMAVKLAVIEKERDAWQIREQDLQQRIHQLKVQLDETQMLLFQCTN